MRQYLEIFGILFWLFASGLVGLGGTVERSKHQPEEALDWGEEVQIAEEEVQLPETEHPYQAIADRNIFALRPIPPPREPEVPKPTPPDVILSGITTLDGETTVFLKVPPVAAKRGQEAKPQQYFALSEGEMDREMKVLEIDEEAGEVKVVFAGTELDLNFEENGAKANAAPLPGAVQNPTARPGYRPPTTPRRITLPTRVQRTPSTTPSSASGYRRPGAY